MLCDPDAVMTLRIIKFSSVCVDHSVALHFTLVRTAPPLSLIGRRSASLIPPSEVTVY